MHYLAPLFALVITVPCLNTAEARDQEKNPQERSAEEAGKRLLALLESVRAAYRQARDNDVLALVDQAFLEVIRSGDHTKDAELYFWRGASYRRQGKNEQALIALEQARVLGYRESQLYLESGLARKSLGQTQEAEQDYEEGKRYLPEDVSQQELYNERWQREGVEFRRFSLFVTPSIGYDSDVVGLDPNTPLFQNVKHFGSFYEGLYLDARYYALKNGHEVLYLEYQGQGRQYPSANDLSYWDDLTSLTFREPIASWADLEFRGAWEEAFVHYDGHFRSERTGGAAAIFQATHDVQVRAWADYSRVTYYDPTTTVEDRTATVPRVGLTVPIDLHQGWSLSPYAVYDEYHSVGTDYRSHGWEGGATVMTPVIEGFRFALTANYSVQDYTEPNSLTNFTERRRDRPYQVILAVTFKQLERLIGAAPMLSFTYYRHESNISAFDYTRYAPQIELGINALSF